MLLLDFLVAIRQRQVGCKRSREARSPNCWIAICKTSTEVDDLIDVCTASDYDVINDEAARTHVRHRCGAGGMMMCSKRKKATSTFHLLSLHGALCPPFRPVSANLVCRCATVSANAARRQQHNNGLWIATVFLFVELCCYQLKVQLSRSLVVLSW